MAITPTLIDTTLYDPWANVDAHQAMRLRADIQIIVDSMDVTSKVNPHLIMVRLLSGVMIEDYNCEIELDDRDGTLPIPAIGAPLEVSIGWRGESYALAWEGTVHDVESGFGRKQGGRRLWIHGLGATMLGHGKSPRNDSEGKGGEDGQEEGEKIPFSQFITRVASEADQTIIVHPMFDGPLYQRDYWQQAGESYYHCAKRYAEEMGALFRVKAGTLGQFTTMNQNVDGTPTPAIDAIWGHNLIAWRVRPMETRHQWASVSSHSFDVTQGAWNAATQNTTQAAPFKMADAAYQASQPAPNAGVAAGGNAGADDGIGQAQGSGRIVINGEPTAQGNCFVNLAGARPGVDGIYWAPTVEQVYSRQGYVTWFDVQAVQVNAAVYQRWLDSALAPNVAGPTQPSSATQLGNVPGTTVPN